MFKDRRLIIATKHKKETVIAPLLQDGLGVVCFTDTTYDTDFFGSFSGEIERINDPLTTLREKCLKAMEINHCDLGVASEGSFGTHPSLHFVSADDELLIFIDKINNLEIVVRELSLNTNFNAKYISSKDELLGFAEGIGFPQHGLILKKSKEDIQDVYKGITDENILIDTFDYLLNKYNQVFAETDMRALYNPTRMSVIETATKKLVDKIKSTCPKCSTPGFGITEVKRGLPCSWCSHPTDSLLSHIYECEKCNYSKEEMYPNNKMKEDPMYCNYCNP